jgi:hypothetical protein
MRRLAAGLRRLGSASIWGAGNVSPSDARLEDLLRSALPRFYGWTAAFGVGGFIGGVPALRDTFGATFAEAVALLLAIAAVACFVGVAFPARFWRWEFIASAFVTVLLIAYALAILVAGVAAGDIGRLAVAFIIYAISALPRWRQRDIARDRRVHGWK